MFYFQTMQDLISRRDLASLLLLVSLITSGTPDPFAALSDIISSMPHDAASSGGAQRAIDDWMPMNLLKKSWFRDGTEEETLWPITVGIILVALTSLRLVISSHSSN